MPNIQDSWAYLKIMGIVENSGLKGICQFSNINKLVWEMYCTKDPKLKIMFRNSNTLGTRNPSVKPSTITHDHSK